MIRKLINHGNDLAIILDQSLLEKLHISPDTELAISTDGASIIITPVREQLSLPKISDDEKIQKAFEKVMKGHASLLKKLAKH